MKVLPLTIESISDSDEKECRVTSPGQILSILRSISESGVQAALYYNANRDFIMTTILEVDEDGMWLEQGSLASANHQIAQSRRLKLVSSHNQVKVQFAVDEAHEVTYDGQPAFFLHMPQALYRFQRREYFRLEFAASEQMRCIVNATRPGGPGVPEPCDFQLADISGGGVGLICREGELELQAGQTYTGCRIDLPGAGPLIFNLTVRYIKPISTTKAGKTISHAGCEFRNLDGATTLRLQRYITDKQRLMAATAGSL